MTSQKEIERILVNYCPKCDVQSTPLGGAAKKAKKHERLYCIFCNGVLELWEFFEDKEKPIKIETHIGSI